LRCRNVDFTAKTKPLTKPTKRTGKKAGARRAVSRSETIEGKGTVPGEKRPAVPGAAGGFRKTKRINKRR
jgi:hypothetical protein